MLYCSLEFTHIGLSVAVHSQWNEELTNCKLRIFTNRQCADDFLAKIPSSERRGFAACAAILESTSDTLGVLELSGDTALSLTSYLIVLSQEGEVGAPITNEPELMGFWGPPTIRAFGTGIIMWFHPNDGYQVIIAYAKEQAAEVVHRFSWLQPEPQELFLEQIEKWKMPRRSADAVQEIGGVIAEVLCKASLAAKVSVAMEEAQAKAHWN